MEEILNKIKTIRKNKGISQDSIANFLKIEPSTYTKIERNEIKLTLERFLLISDFLEAPIEEILNLPVRNNHCQQNDNKHSSEITIQQIEHFHSENKEVSNKLIETLQNENYFLKNEIEFLKKLLEKE